MKIYAIMGNIIRRFGYSNATLVATTAADARTAVQNCGHLFLCSNGYLKFFALNLTVVTKVLDVSRDDKMIFVNAEQGVLVFQI